MWDFKRLFYIYFYMFVCVYIYTGRHMSWHACGSQRTTCRSWFCPSITRIQGINLKLPSLEANVLGYWAISWTLIRRHFLTRTQAEIWDLFTFYLDLIHTTYSGQVVCITLHILVFWLTPNPEGQVWHVPLVAWQCHSNIPENLKRPIWFLSLVSGLSSKLVFYRSSPLFLNSLNLVSVVDTLNYSLVVAPLRSPYLGLSALHRPWTRYLRYSRKESQEKSYEG